MTDYTWTTMKVAIHRKGDNPAYADGVTYIEVVLIALRQFQKCTGSFVKIRIDPEELELILTEAQRMLAGFPEDSDK